MTAREALIVDCSMAATAAVAGWLAAVLLSTWILVAIVAGGTLSLVGFWLSARWEYHRAMLIGHPTGTGQCTTAIYSHYGGPPERCAYPEGHAGECEP
jgi:hypothetical protein